MGTAEDEGLPPVQSVIVPEKKEESKPAPPPIQEPPKQTQDQILLALGVKSEPGSVRYTDTGQLTATPQRLQVPEGSTATISTQNLAKATEALRAYLGRDPTASEIFSVAAGVKVTQRDIERGLIGVTSEPSPTIKVDIIQPTVGASGGEFTFGTLRSPSGELIFAKAVNIPKTPDLPISPPIFKGGATTTRDIPLTGVEQARLGFPEYDIGAKDQLFKISPDTTINLPEYAKFYGLDIKRTPIEVGAEYGPGTGTIIGETITLIPKGAKAITIEPSEIQKLLGYGGETPEFKSTINLNLYADLLARKGFSQAEIVNKLRGLGIDVSQITTGPLDITPSVRPITPIKSEQALFAIEGGAERYLPLSGKQAEEILSAYGGRQEFTILMYTKRGEPLYRPLEPVLSPKEVELATLKSESYYGLPLGAGLKYDVTKGYSRLVTGELFTLPSIQGITKTISGEKSLGPIIGLTGAEFFPSTGGFVRYSPTIQKGAIQYLTTPSNIPDIVPDLVFQTVLFGVGLPKAMGIGAKAVETIPKIGVPTTAFLGRLPSVTKGVLAIAPISGGFEYITSGGDIERTAKATLVGGVFGIGLGAIPLGIRAIKTIGVKGYEGLQDIGAMKAEGIRATQKAEAVGYPEAVVPYKPRVSVAPDAYFPIAKPSVVGIGQPRGLMFEPERIPSAFLRVEARDTLTRLPTREPLKPTYISRDIIPELEAIYGKVDISPSGKPILVPKTGIELDVAHLYPPAETTYISGIGRTRTASMRGVTDVVSESAKVYDEVGRSLKGEQGTITPPEIKDILGLDLPYEGIKLPLERQIVKLGAPGAERYLPLTAEEILARREQIIGGMRLSTMGKVPLPPIDKALRQAVGGQIRTDIETALALDVKTPREILRLTSPEGDIFREDLARLITRTPEQAEIKMKKQFVFLDYPSIREYGKYNLPIIQDLLRGTYGIKKTSMVEATKKYLPLTTEEIAKRYDLGPTVGGMQKSALGVKGFVTKGIFPAGPELPKRVVPRDIIEYPEVQPITTTDLGTITATLSVPLRKQPEFTLGKPKPISDVLRYLAEQAQAEKRIAEIQKSVQQAKKNISTEKLYLLDQDLSKLASLGAFQEDVLKRTVKPIVIEQPKTKLEIPKGIAPEELRRFRGQPKLEERKAEPLGGTVESGRQVLIKRAEEIKPKVEEKVSATVPEGMGIPTVGLTAGLGTFKPTRFNVIVAPITTTQAVKGGATPQPKVQPSISKAPVRPTTITAMRQIPSVEVKPETKPKTITQEAQDTLTITKGLQSEITKELQSTISKPISVEVSTTKVSPRIATRTTLKEQTLSGIKQELREGLGLREDIGLKFRTDVGLKTRVITRTTPTTTPSMPEVSIPILDVPTIRIPRVPRPEPTTGKPPSLLKLPDEFKIGGKRPSKTKEFSLYNITNPFRIPKSLEKSTRKLLFIEKGEL